MQNNLIINLLKYSIIIILLFLLLKSNKPFAALKLPFLNVVIHFSSLAQPLFLDNPNVADISRGTGGVNTSL